MGSKSRKTTVFTLSPCVLDMRTTRYRSAAARGGARFYERYGFSAGPTEMPGTHVWIGRDVRPEHRVFLTEIRLTDGVGTPACSSTW